MADKAFLYLYLNYLIKINQKRIIKIIDTNCENKLSMSKK